MVCVLHAHLPSPVREDLDTRGGLVSKLKICCTNTACNREGVISDPYDTRSLNARSVLGMWEIGRGQAILEFFCDMMDMLPPLGVAA